MLAAITVLHVKERIPFRQMVPSYIPVRLITHRVMPREAKPRESPLEQLAADASSRKREAVRSRLETRQFVVWDGEGARATGRRKPQNYVLFGYYDGAEHGFISGESLGTYECLDFIIECAQKHKDAWHVSFAFGYDTDMILRNLSPKQFAFLRDRGYTRVGDNYRVEHIPGKWIRVTQYGPTFPKVRTDRYSVTIYDVWGFFQSTFVAAIKSYLGLDHPLMKAHLTLVEAGKKRREGFTYEQLPFIERYWRVENELFHALINRLREYLYAVDLRISKWHGPGALASYSYRTQKVKAHKADCGEAIYTAARFAYAGGRFERFHIGRYEHAYGYDINSAYPNAIARLPSLSEGQWIHNANPKRFTEFGIYRISMRGAAITRKPSPLFHRDERGNVSFPWRLDGWYWAPELRAMQNALPEFQNVSIHEGYEYVGYTTRPFAFVHDVYEQRRDMKRDGNGAQIALKLLLNSLYGKQAQRAGWERTGGAPTWHQLEWAGWVTSYTRAMLFELMHSIPYDKLIAVETDGIYTTSTPDELGITHSVELGGWEVSEYDELIYLQSGLYAKRNGPDWSLKFRGLDSDSISVEQVQSHARLLLAHSEWPSLVGTTTRFVGYRNALFREAQNRGPMKAHHRVWETTPKEIDCGSVGKRIHSPAMCAACKAGASAYDMPHETIIKSRAMIGTETDGAYQSHMHEIPWLDEAKQSRFKWRETADAEDGLLRRE